MKCVGKLTSPGAPSNAASSTRSGGHVVVAFSVIVKRLTSRRFVSSSNCHLASYSLDEDVSVQMLSGGG